MVTHMKTTLDISDNLFRRAKKLAAKEGKTFKTVVEEALVSRLEAREQSVTPYLLDIPVVSGEIAPAFVNAPWEKIRDEIYPYPFSSAQSAERVHEPSATYAAAAKRSAKPVAKRK